MLKIAELACLIFIYLDLYSGKISYHLGNDTVLLPCQHLTDKPIWYGPPNLTVYSIGVKLNTKLSNSDRLFIIHSDGSHQYNLGIRNFSIDDEGQYKCFKGGSQKDVQEIYFNLKKAKAPSNLTIETEDSNHIVYGYLNKLFNLTCTVNQGIPKGKLLWLVNDKTLAETDTSSLVHSFKPKQKDHLKQLTCVSRSNFYDFELSRSVKLFVYIPPNVLIFPNQNPVILDEGDDLTLYCNYSSNHNITDLKWNRLMSMKSQLGTSQSSPDLSIENIKRENAGQYVCTVSNMAGNGSDNLTVKVNSLLKAPQNIMAVTFSDRIIVKWTSALDIGMQETFFVEYRKHIETSWSQVSVEDKYTAVINGLVADTVYLIRVYSRTPSGKSYRTDNTIVKTEKQRSNAIVFSLELAVTLGGVLLVPYLCFCGMKVFKNREKFCRNNDRREAQANRHAETSAQPAHYDEIDSMYNNPINETISSQNIIDNAQRTALTGNAGLENSSSENITPYINIQLTSSHANNSPGSSSEESYLVPCSNYMDLDLEKLSDNQDANIDIDDPEIIYDESSVSSDNSNTNIKSIQRYESLKGSDINEHCYRNYNDIDV